MHPKVQRSTIFRLDKSLETNAVLVSFFAFPEFPKCCPFFFVRAPVSSVATLRVASIWIELLRTRRRIGRRLYESGRGVRLLYYELDDRFLFVHVCTDHTSTYTGYVSRLAWANLGDQREVGERASQNKFPHSQLLRADCDHRVSLRFGLIKWVRGQLTSCASLL